MVEELGFETVCKLFPLLEPEPYEGDVRKHQSGKHDQKLHGSWSDGSSDLPEGWTQQSEESRVEEFISRQRAEGSTDTDERLTKVYGKAFANTDEYAGPNSTRVVVSRDAKVSADDLSTQLKGVADLQRIAPVQDLRVEIGDQAFRFAQLDDGVGGFVVQGGQTIYLRPSSVTDGIDKSKGNLMRVLNKKTYALVHEYGHVLDQRSAETSSDDKRNVLAGATSGASRYALSEEPLGAAGREAFAEAWTGWVGSQGMLAKPFRNQQSFVGYFAEKYGWDAGGDGRAPSAGVAKAQGRMILADTFTDEGPVVQFVPEATVIQFAPGLVPVLKHADHDQLSHGRWARSMRGYEERTPSGRGQRSRGSSEAPSDQARREAIENVDYIMGRTTRAPDWTGPSDPLYVPARSLGDRVQSARRKIAAWRQSRDRRSMERMTSAELETLGAKNRERARRKREKLGLPPFVSKSFDPVYEILQRIFVDAVEPSLWVELVEDPRSLVDLTGPLGDLVDDMLNAVVPLGSVVKFAPGLRPVLKHQSGKHDQKKHGSWSDQAGVQKAADMWVGGTEKFSYQMVNEIRGTARVLTGDNDYYPKDDSRGDPTEVFDSTKSLLLEIADAPPSDVPLYRGLNLNSYDGIGAQILEKGTVFEELAASWTPNQNIADQFATGEIAGRNTFLLAITLRVEKLPAVEMMEHYSGDKSGIIGQADERVASGKYRVENVNSLGDGKYLVDVSFQGLPFDPEVVRNTEYTGGRSTFQPRRSAIVRKSAESDLAARMSLDIDALVVKHQSGKHDQKLHGSWADQMELEGLESPLSGEYGDWGDRAAELEAARSIGPDEEYLRDTILFKPDPRSVSDMAVRERIEEYHESDIFNEVEQRMSSLEDEDMSEYEGLSNDSIKDKFIEEAVDQYVADYGDEARQAIAMENATVAFDSDSMGEVFNVTHEGFNRDGAPVNLSSQVLEVESSNGQVSVRGEIKEGDYDITVGEFHRVFSSDADGNVIVTHELLQIFDEEYQGTGFSKVFNRQAENYYITHGIDTVYVHAALKGGGYTWASSGFDWDYRKHADSVQNVSAWMADYIIKNRDTIPDDLKSDLRSLQTRLESSPVSNRDYPTPKEIADFGRISGVDTWPGKEILMGSNWYGKKTLRPEGARVSETQAKNNAARAAREASEQERARAAAESAPTRGQLTMDTGFLEGSLAQDPNFQPGLFSPIPGVVE